MDSVNHSLFFVTINWYDNYADKDKINCAFVLANNFTDAAYLVIKDFNYVNKLEIEEVIHDGVNILYVPNDPYLIQKIKDENNY